MTIMRQSNFIFGALAVAFVVFITIRGSLPVYMSVIFGTASAPAEKGADTISGATGATGFQGAAQGQAKQIFDGFKGMFQ